MDKHTEDLVKVLNAHADYFERKGRSSSPILALIVLSAMLYGAYRFISFLI